MNILIAGASGFIGKSIAEYLKETLPDANIFGLSRTNPHLECFTQYYCKDLSQPLELSGTFDVIINSSGKAGYDLSDSEMEKTHLITNRNLLNFAQKNNCQTYILFSTSSIYMQNRDIIDLKEEDIPATFFNSYARIKRAAENETLNNSTNMQKIILRPRMVMGRGDTSWLPFLNDYANRRIYVQPSPGIMIQPTPVKLLGETIRHVLQLKKMDSGIYNIAGSTPVAYRYLFSLLTKDHMKGKQIKLTCPKYLGQLLLRTNLFAGRHLSDMLFNISCSMTLNCEKIQKTGLNLQEFKIEDAIVSYLKSE